MSERIRIGNVLGTAGFAMSRPGDNASAPAKSLLIDPRFPTLSIHASGRVRLARWYNEATGMTLFYTQIGFADLGYVPMHFYSFIYGDANSLGVPPNTAYFPGSWSGSDSYAGSDMTENLNNKFRESGCWISGTTLLGAKTWVETQADLNIQLLYYVFKNRRDA